MYSCLLDWCILSLIHKKTDKKLILLYTIVVFGLGFTEIVFIFLIFIILFGPEEIPSIAKKCGKFYRNITSLKDEINENVNKEINDIKEITKK